MFAQVEADVENDMEKFLLYANVVTEEDKVQFLVRLL